MTAADFQGRTALVTGGSRGVGFALAEQFLRHGARVVISARGKDRLQRSLERLSAVGPEVAAVTGDVGIYDDASHMVETAVGEFGGLDIVVNNAGVSMRGAFSELAPATCETILSSNLLGSIHVSRAAVDHVRERQGSIVFISSIAGLFGLPGASVYCAAKGGMTGLAESLRTELADSGVHVGVAHLGFTEHDPEKRILGADGSELPADRPAHHTQARAAALVIDMIRRRRDRVVLTPIGKIGAAAHRLSPRLLSWLIRRAGSWDLKTARDFS